jgi:hypothetical protein
LSRSSCPGAPHVADPVQNNVAVGGGGQPVLGAQPLMLTMGILPPFRSTPFAPRSFIVRLPRFAFPAAGVSCAGLLPLLFRVIVPSGTSLPIVTHPGNRITPRRPDRGAVAIVQPLPVGGGGMQVIRLPGIRPPLASFAPAARSFIVRFPSFALPALDFPSAGCLALAFRVMVVLPSRVRPRWSPSRDRAASGGPDTAGPDSPASSRASPPTPAPAGASRCRRHSRSRVRSPRGGRHPTRPAGRAARRMRGPGSVPPGPPDRSG